MVIKPIHMKVAAAGVILIVVSAVVAGAIWLIGMSSDEHKADVAVTKVIEKTQPQPEEVMDVMTQVSFAELPKKRVDQLVVKFQDMHKSGQRPQMPNMDNLSQSQRDQMRKNMRFMFRKMMQAKVDAFGQLKTKAERDAFLDKEIDDRANRMRGPRPDHNRNRGGNDQNRQRPTREQRRARRKVRMDQGSSVERAKFTNYMHALHNRMKERGIQGRGRGRH